MSLPLNVPSHSVIVTIFESDFKNSVNPTITESARPLLNSFLITYTPHDLAIPTVLSVLLLSMTIIS